MKSKLRIVDNGNVSRVMIQGLCAVLQTDWLVIEASSGDEAFALLPSATSDFITIDVNMPGVTGLEATEKIRHGVGQATPAISELVGETVLHATQSLDNLILSLQINFKIASRHIQGCLVFLLGVKSRGLPKRRPTPSLGLCHE